MFRITLTLGRRIGLRPAPLTLTANPNPNRKLTVSVRPKSLVLFGPTRTGKTTWARSLGSHVYFMGMMSGEVAIRDMPDAEYAIFDDMRGGIKFFQSWKEWFGAQMVVTVKKLYRDPVQITWGKPCIWIANRDPRLDMDHDDVDWMEGNCVFIEVGHSFISHANNTLPREQTEESV